jgi:hypothetical protein
MIKSPAVERNKKYIGDVLSNLVINQRHERRVNVFEVASGSGEHALYFNTLIPNLCYQPSDPSLEAVDSIEMYTSELRDRVLKPVVFNIMDYEQLRLPTEMEDSGVDIVVCINMIHISPFECTRSLFKSSDKFGNAGVKILTYGPYRVNGLMVQSNLEFDSSLRTRNPAWGVRDVAEVEEAAHLSGFVLRESIAMPANNLCLIFERSSS